VATFLSTTAHAQLDADGVQCLQVMDSASVDQVLELTRQVATWRQTMQDARRVIELASQATGGVTVDADAEKAAAQLIAIAQHLQRQQQLIQRFIPAVGIDRLQRRIDVAGARAEIGQRVAAAKELVAELDRIVEKIQKLREPAQFAKSFVEEKIEGQLGKPQKWGDDLTFVIEKSDPTKSLFAADANLEVKIEYQDGISVKATGLYFKYRPNAIPEPCFDKMDVDKVSLNSLTQVGLKYLGDAIPADLGLPIKIKSPQFNGFSPADGKPPGSISFSVEIGGFLDFAKELVLSAEDVTISSTGKVTVAGFKCPLPGQVFIGATGLIFDGGKIELRPQNRDETVTIETHIAAASGKESLSLDVKITFGLPLQSVKYAGALVLADGAQLGKVEGEISGEHVTGSLSIPGDGPLPPREILEGKFKFELNKSGFTADGMAAVFGAVRFQMDLALRFDGSGHLNASHSFSIAGVDVEASLSVRVEAGFRRVEMEALLAVDVNLQLFHAEASVLVQASSDSGINVVAKAMGASAEFRVASLNELNPKKIAEELVKELDDILSNIAVAAAKWEQDKRELLAKWEDHWRDTLHEEAKKYGLDSIATGDPNVDRMLGDMAREGKASGKWVSDVWKKSGGEAARFVQDPARTVRDLPGNARREAENAGQAISNTANRLSGGRFGSPKPDDDSGPSAAELRAEQLQQQVEAKLVAITDAANRVHREERLPEEHHAAGNKFYGRSAELRFTFDNAVGISEGSGNGSLGLTVSASSLSSRVRLGKNQHVDRQHEATVTAATVHFTSLLPRHPADLKEGEVQSNPNARIEVQPINDVSGLNAEQLVRLELQKLIERYLPEVEIEGPKKFVESLITVRNDTQETVNVWAKVRTRRVVANRLTWEWSPASPDAAGAHKISVPAGETRLMSRSFKATGRFLPKGGVSLGAAVHGDRMRIWAESESGERWTNDKEKPVYLIEPNAALNGERAYVDKDMRTYTYVISPHEGNRVFTERQLALQNKTREDLTVDLVCRTTQGNKQRWLRLPGLSIKAGETLEPRQEDGFRICASRVYLVARSENLRYLAYKTTPLWLVDETAAGRVYGQERIGRFTHVFDVGSADRN
jgi:hypothetical protein